MSQATYNADTGRFASSRALPDSNDRWFVTQRLGTYPLSAIARMSGRSLTFVQSVAADRAYDDAERANERRRRAMIVPSVPAPPALPRRVRRLITETAERHGLTFEDLIGQSRKRSIIPARHEAFALVRALRKPPLEPYSWPQIGEWFGGRDHSTIIHGARQYEARSEP